jgi:thiamine biosynthesis lipoprotein
VERINLARNAMATRFEFVLLGDDPVRLRAAGEEAFDEIDRIEGQLSLYRPGSEIATVNARAAHHAVSVSPEVFALIERAVNFSKITGGSFDITIAPLVRTWGFMKGNGARPTDTQIAEAREVVGSQFLQLDSDRYTVRFKRAGMMLDLGSIGKGYALDIAADVLRDAGVENALLHGGTSTIYALGEDAVGPWKIAIDPPTLPAGSEGEQPTTPTTPLAIVPLSNEALSVSAVWGKFFNLDGKTYGHVIDPRTGWPAEDALLGAVVVGSAAESDALSTAVLLAVEDDLEALRQTMTQLKFLQAKLKDGNVRTVAQGFEITETGFR